MLQVNTLSNIRKARLGRLDPVFKVTSKALLKSRAFNILPPEVVAEHEAKSRVSIAQRLTAQGDPGLAFQTTHAMPTSNNPHMTSISSLLAKAFLQDNLRKQKGQKSESFSSLQAVF